MFGLFFLMKEQQSPRSPGEEGWMALLVWQQCPLKRRSSIKPHRLAHFSPRQGWISWYHAVTHSAVSPNPYSTELGYLSQSALCGFVSAFQRFPVFSWSHSTLLFVWLCTLTALCPSTLTFLPPFSALLPVLQLTLSQRWSLTHRGSCWPPGIKEAEWLSSRGSRR